MSGKVKVGGGLASEKTLKAVETALGSVGGGVQYTEGDADATITGTAIMWEDTGDTLRPVSSTTPLPVDVLSGGGGGFAVSNAIQSTAFDLNAGAYSVSSSISEDYLLSHIQFNFSSTQSRDITVTAADGTILWSVTGDTSLDIVLEDIEKCFNSGEDFTIDITQTGGACTVDVLATIKTNASGGGAALSTLVDSGNSSSTPLGGSAVFTGTGRETTGYPAVVVSTYADQVGTVAIQFSTDNTNWDSALSYRTAANINKVHKLTITKKYVRVVYTNGSSAQSTFRMQTLLGPYEHLVSPANLTIANDADAQVVRPTDFHYEVGRGKWGDASTVNKFGYNPDVDSASSEGIWSEGGNFTILSSASTLDVVSASANDTNSSGTGARTLQITGLDANRAEQTEVVNLNGTSTVTTTNTFLGINRAVILTSGSSKWNEGDITITATTGGSTQAHLPAEQSVTQQCIYFVPANHTFLADWLHINVNKISGGASPRVTIYGYVESFLTDTVYEVFRATIDTDVENTIDLTPSQPFVVDEQGVLYFVAETSTNNTVVAMRFSGIIQRND